MNDEETKLWQAQRRRRAAAVGLANEIHVHDRAGWPLMADLDPELWEFYGAAEELARVTAELVQMREPMPPGIEGLVQEYLAAVDAVDAAESGR